MAATVLWTFIILGVMVCAVLAVKIAKQLRFLGLHKQELASSKAKLQANKEKLRESIRILCSSMIDDQVEISEGCMRVKILLDHLDARLHHDEVLGIFNQVYDRLESMPRFKERKTVNRKILDKLDQTRFSVEDEYRDRVLTACRALLSEMP